MWFPKEKPRENSYSTFSNIGEYILQRSLIVLGMRWGANQHSQGPKRRTEMRHLTSLSMWHGKEQLLMKHLFNLQLLGLVIFQDNYIKYKCRPSGKFQILCKSEPRMVFHFGFALSCVCTSMYICKCAHMNMCVYECTCVCMNAHVCGAGRNLWPCTWSILYQGTISLATAWIL